MRLKIEGFEKDIPKMVAKLETTKQDSGKVGYKIIKVVVAKLREEAMLRAPVDEGVLEGSFDEKIIKAAMLSEVEGQVFIPANAPSSDYALLMHEGEYNLGPKSQEKNAAVAPDVGQKYLERALTENQKAFGLYIYKKLKEFIENGK